MKIAEKTFVSLDYKLEVDGKIADRSQPGNPLSFPFGAGYLLPKFEENIAGLEPGDKFSFTLSPAEGYGEVMKEAIIELPKDVFMVNGTIEDGLLSVGNQIPMSDANGNRLLGTVVAVGETVTMDFNHPMAGKTLNFTGEIVGVREVKPEDLQPAGGCGCGCGDCEEGCGEHDHDCDCECGCGCH